MTTIEAIHEAEPEALAAIFEAAFMRLGELGRNGGVAVCARLKGHEGWDVEAFYVNCIRCGAVSRSGIVGGYQTKAEAIERWNSRPQPTPAGEIVERAQALIDAYRPQGMPQLLPPGSHEAALKRVAAVLAASDEQQAATIAERDAWIEALESDDLVLAVARAMKPKLFGPDLTEESLDAPGMYIVRDQVFWMAKQAIATIRATLERTRGQ